MKGQRVSVIIPTLNEEERIATLLEALVGLPDVEVIVSDGGSDDRTVEVCGRYPVTVVESARGRGTQMNAGARRATGDILLFLHADTGLTPRVLDEIRVAVGRGDRWGCCTLMFDEETPFFRAVASLSNLRARLLGSCYGDQGIFCEKDLFLAVGGFPDAALMEDVLLSRRLRRVAPSCVVPGRVTTSTRRFRAGGPVRTIARMQAIKVLFALGVNPERLERWYRAGAGQA